MPESDHYFSLPDEHDASASNTVANAVASINRRIFANPHNVLHYLAFMVAVLPRWDDLHAGMPTDLHKECSVFLRANIQGPHAFICANIQELFAHTEGRSSRGSSAISDNDMLLTVQAHWDFFSKIALLASAEDVRLFSAVVNQVLGNTRPLLPGRGLPADCVLLAKTFYFLDHCKALQAHLAAFNPTSTEVTFSAYVPIPVQQTVKNITMRHSPARKYPHSLPPQPPRNMENCSCDYAVIFDKIDQ